MEECEHFEDLLVMYCGEEEDICPLCLQAEVAKLKEELKNKELVERRLRLSWKEEGETIAKLKEQAVQHHMEAAKFLSERAALKEQVSILKDSKLKPCVTCGVFNDNDKLKQFARDIISDECWDLGGSQNRDGADVQDWAESLGLIKKGKATAEQAEASDGLFEEGDDFYTFSDILKD